jgi:uncharacterized protein (DUF2126 family)
VTCNGRQVPLMSTGEGGEAIAGVRYRARRLSASLHPTIPLHVPLVFDLIDRWKEQSIGRCTYYAGPPDGSLYERRPVSAAEAEERRSERFQVSTHAPGKVAMPVSETNAIFPMTLDLRMPAPGEKVGVVE